MPCEHDKQVPEGDVVVYDGGTGGAVRSAERMGRATLWASAHGRKVLGEFVELPHTTDLVDFGNAAAMLDERPDAYLLVTHAEALHRNPATRRFLATRVGGRVICMSGETIEYDFPVEADADAAPAAGGDSAEVASS